MKLALLSSIHGNLPALEAVDADIAKQAPDRIICLGDIIGYGAQPRECIAFVRERGWPTVLGNHEATVHEPSRLESYNPYAKAAGYFTLGALGKAEREWIRTLPMSIDINGWLMIHASPHQPQQFHYMLDEASVRACFDACANPLIFIGHACVPVVLFDEPNLVFSRESHITLESSRRAIVNAGSVGQPRDKDPRACWALFDSDSRILTIRRVDYDQAEAKRRIIEAGLPPRLGERLLGGN